MQIVLPDIETRARIEVIEEWRPLTDEEFYRFCTNNPDVLIEREANGDIIIMPPTGGETGDRSSELNYQLRAWARQDGRGRVFDSNTAFFLPSGAAYMPDACWVSRNRLETLSKLQKKQFMPLCPEFVVELTSPSDRLSKVQAKMREWMANGAALGWLIDADRQTVYIYRPQREPVELTSIDHVDGEGPVDGFRLELNDIWAGL
jgi:Uma2 family endonuclease